MTFVLNKEAIYNHPRVHLIRDVLPIDEYLDDIEKAIQFCYDNPPFSDVVQHGRVIALRATDYNRLSSAFKAALYLGKYNDMNNTERFLNKMVKAHHSYEPIRGENILFLFIGVGKPVYDHLVTYTVGRPTRIAGGQRANLPWGFEAPTELRQGASSDLFIEEGIERVKRIVQIVKGVDKEISKQQMQVARSLLPVGYIMPPFLMEFSEEALVKHVFKQRIWENGAQGATVDIVSDMWKCVMDLDPEKWSTLFDYHGPHIARWEKAIRTIRDKEITVKDLMQAVYKYKELSSIHDAENDTNKEQKKHDELESMALYDVLVNVYGKLPPSMWEKQQP